MRPFHTVVLRSAGVHVELTRYGPGEHQPRHADRHSRITLVLRGGLREEGHSTATLEPGGLLFKSHTVPHADWFGERGATLASLAFQDHDAFAGAGWSHLWRPTHEAAALRLAMAALEAALRSDAAGVQACAADLLASLHGPESRRAPPPWLQRLREELAETGLAGVDVAARACQAGAHPSHASRLFRRCYGASITGYAQAQSVRRALRLLDDEHLRLSDVALGAGFYDQSHMNRVFRRLTGRPPGAHRRLVERGDAAVGGQERPRPGLPKAPRWRP
jgi:AraC family transcriptional regulator